MAEEDLRTGRAFREAVEALLRGGNLGEARERAESGLQQFPDDVDARIALCRVWMAQGRLADAEALLGPMTETLATLSEAYVCLGDIHGAAGRRDEAAGCYRKFLLLNPGTPLARELEARLEAATAGHEAADDGETPEEDGAVPADFQTLTLADLYIRQGHLAMAEEVLEAILRRDPRQEKAAARLEEVRQGVRRAVAGRPSGPVIGELNRWLANVDRLRSHGG